MTETTLYKRVFQKYWVQQNRDRSLLQKNKKEYYDGVHPLFDVVSVFSDEKSFYENLKDPLYSLKQYSLTIVVEQKDHKVSIKAFSKEFGRKAGTSYYTLKKNMIFLTVNVLTGNIYQGYLNNYQNKKKVQKKVRVNFLISRSFNTFRIQMKNLISYFDVDNNSYIINEAFDIFIKKVDGGEKFLSIPSRLFKFFLDKKNIKYPNNFIIYSDSFFGDFRKILKKNDNKIVDSFMSINNLNGKKIKKVLHTVDNLNIQNYKNGLKMFGSDWLNQDESLLKDIFNNKISFEVSENLSEEFNQLSSLKEKRRAFQMYKNFNKNNEVDGWTLRDHFVFFVTLKRYGDTEVEWRSSSNTESFRQEHLDWADKISFYKKGEYKRIYPEKFFDAFQNFSIDGKIYFPVLLTSTPEYNDESSVQTNCVRTYIGHPSSFIISLRIGEKNSLDRLTVEYKIVYLKNSDIVHLDRVQTRAKYNQKPDESWDKPLEILDGIVNNIIVDKKFQTYQLIKKCANGVELKSDTHFDENGKLVWTYESIDNHNHPLNFFL